MLQVRGEEGKVQSHTPLPDYGFNSFSVHDFPRQQENMTSASDGEDSVLWGAVVSPINTWEFVQHSVTAANCKFWKWFAPGHG